MKTTMNVKWAGVAFAAIAFVGLSPSAKAIIDLGGYTGAVTFHISNLDSGVVYALPGGTFSNGSATAGSSTSVAAGITAMNGLTQTAAPGTVGSTDSWGIFQVDQILGSASQVLYDKSTPGARALEGIFYNTQDFAGSVVGSSQYISSSGLKVDLYSMTTGISLGAATTLPSGHGPLDSQFSGITNAPGVLLELSTTGRAGLFGAASVVNPGGLLSDFNTNFDAGTLTGGGKAWLDINGGASAAELNMNTEIGGTDLAVVFSASPTYGQYHSPWTTASSDPITGTIIPEPSTVLAGIACLLPVFGAGYRRFKKLSAHL